MGEAARKLEPGLVCSNCLEHGHTRRTCANPTARKICGQCSKEVPKLMSGRLCRSCYDRMRRLSTDLPFLHRQFDVARSAAAGDALLGSIQTETQPGKVILDSREGIRRRLSDIVDGALPGPLCEELADAETGRLIGECPLDWRDADGE